MSKNKKKEPEKTQVQQEEIVKMAEVGATEDIITDEKQASSTPETTQENTLPEGVTTEPRNAEEMHIGLIQDTPSLIDVYLAVSDDAGNLHGSVDLEEEVKAFCDRYKDINQQRIDDPNRLLEETKILSSRYASAINKSDKITSGIITKYLIRLGMVFNIEKVIVRKLNLNWIEWFHANHKMMSLRSAQDYMALAKTPNIIRYAFCGKERLMEILRVVKDSKADDPVGDYLRDHGVVFDPGSDDRETALQLKTEIDTVIAMIRISAVEQKKEVELGVDPELIRSLIGLKIDVDNSLIRDLVIIKENGGDPNRYLENRYINNGAEDRIIDATKKLSSIPKLVASLKSAVEFIRENSELVSQIRLEQIEDFERQISELKALITNN